MKITRITVSAQRKVPHPVQEFASISALVSLEADLGLEDVAGACVLRLQADAEDLAESHLRKTVARLAAQSRMEKVAGDVKAATEARLDQLVEKRRTA